MYILEPGAWTFLPEYIILSHLIKRFDDNLWLETIHIYEHQIFFLF